MTTKEAWAAWSLLAVFALAAMAGLANYASARLDGVGKTVSLVRFCVHKENAVRAAKAYATGSSKDYAAAVSGDTGCRDYAKFAAHGAEGPTVIIEKIYKYDDGITIYAAGRNDGQGALLYTWGTV